MRKPVNIFTKTLRKLSEHDSVMRGAVEGVAREHEIAIAWLKSRGKPFDAADIMLIAALVDGDWELPDNYLTLARTWFDSQAIEPSVAELCAMAICFLNRAEELNSDRGVQRT